jgi:uncharacterized protein YjiS (DUF1127 family)
MQKILRLEGHAIAPSAGAIAAALGSQALRAARDVSATISVWAMRRGTRRALAELERHHLLDIGKTPDEARREAAKPFWQV